MTKFNNLVKILEKNNEKKTVFTHYIDIKSERIHKVSIQIKLFKSVDYLGTKLGADVFRAIDLEDNVHFYLGKKGDEFD